MSDQQPQPRAEWKNPWPPIEDSYELRRTILSVSMDPMPGGRKDVELYFDLRIVGDPQGPVWHEWTTAMCANFMSLAQKLGLVQPPVPGQPVEGVTTAKVSGRSEVLAYLFQNNLGAAAYISAHENMSVSAIGQPEGLVDSHRSYTFCGVLPTAVAEQLHFIVERFLEGNGCRTEDLTPRKGGADATAGADSPG